MCGIFGFTDFKKPNLDRARQSLHTLHHRGPDQWNDYFDDKIYIGHQRLSILDLSEQGKQPMISKDENVIITVNGEIYNFKDLKKELEGKYKFTSTSDSEVILYGYIEWGIDILLEKIDGMYAICIYDKQIEELFLIRDRVGIKPLFYGQISNQISWASELKAIQKLYEEEEVLTYDYTALYDFLTYRFIPTPKSLYNNIYKLEPGHYLKVCTKKNTFKKIKYWELEINTISDDLETAKEKLYDLVDKSVDEQMVADVPVGFFLSGGMDSSTIVALASKTHNDVNTFSIGFSDKEHDETYYADLVADLYFTKHNKKILDEDSIKAVFHKIKQWYDEPFGDTSCFPSYLVSEFAKQNSTVVLTGDGGDELFGGYSWYQKFIKTQNTPLKKLKFLKMVASALSSKNTFWGTIFEKLNIILTEDEVEQYALIRGALSKSQKMKYKNSWGIRDDYDEFWYYRKFYKKDLDVYTRLQFVDFNTYLPDDILTKVDRVSMAVSLECRVPFLKKDIIEYCFSLSSKVRINNNQLKGVMKEAFKRILPDEILNRGKRGFSIPSGNFKELRANKISKQEKILNDFGFYVQ